MKLRKNRKSEAGNIYIELLLALFVWLIILGTLIPSFMKLTMDRKNLLIEHHAHKLLRDYSICLIQGEILESQLVEKNDYSYFIDINDRSRICVYYQLIGSQREQHICQNY